MNIGYILIKNNNCFFPEISPPISFLCILTPLIITNNQNTMPFMSKKKKLQIILTLQQPMDWDHHH